ncbi:MAG: Bug family tripartite tricarboxylate transporter substrate binding protein [bacterium]
MHRSRSLRLGVAIGLLAGAMSAHAQSFPNRSLRIVVHFPPGGPVDFVARALGQRLGDAWKQPVVIENRPGAGGVVGVEMVLRSPPDGHTLLLGTSGSMAVAPAVSKLPYDVFTDLAPIALLVINPQILVVHPSLPVRPVSELVTLAQSKPGQINYASVGPGSPNHMGMELLKSMTGMDMVHIPYKGTTPAMTDVISGQVSLLFNSMPSVLPHIKSGRLRAIAVGSAKRSPAAPDVPTVSETPGLQAFQYTTWYGLYGPAAMPRDIVNQINTETVRALNQPDMSELFASQGAEPAPSSPEGLAKFMRAEFEAWRKVIKAAKITLQ